MIITALKHYIIDSVLNAFQTNLDVVDREYNLFIYKPHIDLQGGALKFVLYHGINKSTGWIYYDSDCRGYTLSIDNIYTLYNNSTDAHASMNKNLIHKFSIPDLGNRPFKFRICQTVIESLPFHVYVLND